jgi:hypothetical protein
MAWTQPATKAAQIGLLYPGFEAVTVTRIAALRDGLRAVGYADADRAEKSGCNRRHKPVSAPVGKIGDFDYSDYRQRSRKRSGQQPLCNKPRAPRRQHYWRVFQNPFCCAPTTSSNDRS